MILLLLTVTGCSIPGLSVGAVKTVPCPSKLVTLDKGEEPVEPARGEGRYSEVETFIVDLKLYLAGWKRQAKAREEQVTECAEITG